MSEQERSLGKYLLEARLNAGLTFKEFRKRFRVPASTMLRIEVGAVPSPKNFKLLEKAITRLGGSKKELRRLYKKAYIKQRERRARKRRGVL